MIINNITTVTDDSERHMPTEGHPVGNVVGMHGNEHVLVAAQSHSLVERTIVINGSRQKYEIEYNATFSTVVRYESIRTQKKLTGL